MVSVENTLREGSALPHCSSISIELRYLTRSRFGGSASAQEKVLTLSGEIELSDQVHVSVCGVFTTNIHTTVHHRDSDSPVQSKRHAHTSNMLDGRAGSPRRDRTGRIIYQALLCISGQEPWRTLASPTCCYDARAGFHTRRVQRRCGATAVPTMSTSFVFQPHTACDTQPVGFTDVRVSLILGSRLEQAG